MKIAILGGGLSGLSAALNLEGDIEIYEKNDIGGLASSFKIQKYHIPKYYHHIIKHNKTTIKYLKRYGLLDGEWKRIRMAILNKGKITNIHSLKGLLSYNDLSFKGKLNLVMFGIYTLFFLNPKKVYGDAYSWLSRVAGKELTLKFFHQLYARNKFNIPLKDISASQLAHRLKEREIYAPFFYPRKGLYKMIEGMTKEILNKGNKIKKGIVECVDLKKKEIKFNGKKEKYDIIINSIPIPEFLKIAKGLPKEYKNSLEKVRYTPAVSICFGTDKFLDKRFYWMNIFGEKPHIIIQHSILNDNYPFKVNYILRYGGSEEDLKKDNKEIAIEYLKVVKKYFPNTRILWYRVFKERYAEPIYEKVYKEYMPHYTTPIKGLYMTGIQVTYPLIRNMNSALKSGEKVAEYAKNYR